MIDCPLDEMNRPRASAGPRLRVPSAGEEIEQLFTGWREELATCRKFAPAARNYAAAWLGASVGPRINEAHMLDLDDVRWELGRFELDARPYRRPDLHLRARLPLAGRPPGPGRSFGRGPGGRYADLARSTPSPAVRPSLQVEPAPPLLQLHLLVAETEEDEALPAPGEADEVGLPGYVFRIHDFPALLASAGPGSDASPAIWTLVDRDYETLRIGIQALFHHLGIRSTVKVLDP